MAKLNFPAGDPPVPATYTEAGITWTWNNTLKVWSTDDNDGFTQIDADGRYLRIDAGAGAQKVESTAGVTFKGLTTHRDNVFVTGGRLLVTSTNNEKAVLAFPKDQAFKNAIDVNGYSQGLITASADSGNTLASGAGLAAFQAAANFEAQITLADSTSRLVGFEADLKASADNNVYNIYAAGTAPSYFKGLTEHAAGVSLTGAGTFACGVAGSNAGNGLSLRVNSYDSVQLRDYGIKYSGPASQEFWNTTNKKSVFAGYITSGTPTSKICNLFCANFDPNDLKSTEEHTLVQARLSITGNAAGNAKYLKHFSANTSSDQDNISNLYGYTSNIGVGTGTNRYNIYMSGNAPNYFAGGVQFDTAAGTSALDDYEEGTFTVACDNAATDPMTKDELSFYRVIGKTVLYAIRIGLNSDGVSTILPAGSYAVTGFPFTNIGANSGGVVTFIGQNSSTRGSILGTFLVKSGGYLGLEFTLDSPINNVRMIRCTVTAALN